MVPRARKNTTIDPSANPFQALGEASLDPLSGVGGPRPSVVVESRAPTPSLFGASPSLFIGGGAGPLPFAAKPPTAKRPRSKTSYLPGFTSETDSRSYWVQRFAAAAAAQETPVWMPSSPRSPDFLQRFRLTSSRRRRSSVLQSNAQSPLVVAHTKASIDLRGG